jgi:hypothetical protein
MGSSSTKLSRRSIFAGAGAAAGVAAVATLVPSTPKDSPGADTAQRPAPSRGGGYRLSEHVKQYYKTTRI